MDKKAVIIGVKGLVIAPISAESSSATTYGAVESIPGVIEIAMTKNVTDEKLGADDNVAYEMLTSLDTVDVTLNVAALGTKTVAALLGHDYDNTTKSMTVASDDVAPYYAIGFEATKTDGTGRKVWLLRGRFSDSDGRIKRSAA